MYFGLFSPYSIKRASLCGGCPIAKHSFALLRMMCKEREIKVGGKEKEQEGQ
jgi:hypothetical protein